MRITVKSAGASSKLNDMVLIYDEAGILWTSSHIDLFADPGPQYCELTKRLAGQEDITFQLEEVPF